LTAGPNQTTKEKPLSWNYLIRSAQEMFCDGDVLLQETFRYRDVLLLRRCVYRRFVWRRFVEEMFCRGDVLYVRLQIISKRGSITRNMPIIILKF
jgi:hypothetical protein